MHTDGHTYTFISNSTLWELPWPHAILIWHLITHFTEETIFLLPTTRCPVRKNNLDRSSEESFRVGGTYVILTSDRYTVPQHKIPQKTPEQREKSLSAQLHFPQLVTVSEISHSNNVSEYSATAVPLFDLTLTWVVSIRGYNGSLFDSEHQFDS